MLRRVDVKSKRKRYCKFMIVIDIIAETSANEVL